VRSIRDIQTSLRRAASREPPGTWLRANGYDEFSLMEKRHPNRVDLDGAAPHHPVKLTHRSGHAHVLNTLALAAAGISIDTADPEGALIDRDPHTGEPTGLLFGMGRFLAGRIPRLDDSLVETGVRVANGEFLARGVTSVHDPSPRNGPAQWRRFRRWKDSGILEPRVTMMLGWDEFSRFTAADFPSAAEEQLRLAGVKFVIGEASGELHPPPPALADMITTVHRAGWQAAMHAVDERGISAAADAIAHAVAAFPRAGHRHRIEHGSVCPLALQRRLASLDVVVITHPSFVYYNGARYRATVPAHELADLYPLAGLLAAGVEVAAGSDSPIVPLDPLKAIGAAVSRTAGDGERVGPGQAITLTAALAMHTLSAARAAFEETWKGTITPGKRADLVVLDRDLESAGPDEIGEANVAATILDGRIAWQR
jgi:predicted amidohydrolase YtcJ